MPTPTTIHPAPPQLIHARRLIIASNRGPVEYYLSHDQALKSRRGAGGMVTALIDAGSRMDVSWVAMAMTEGDRIAFREAQKNNDGLLPSPIRGQKMELRYISIPKTANRKYYEQISNRLLWFLQHYMYDPIEDSINNQNIQDAGNNGYCVANQAIADSVNTENERQENITILMLDDCQRYLA